MEFSHDPQTAERQMNAVITYLTAFGYIDGSFDHDERTFLRGYIGKLVQGRADRALGAEASDLKAELVGKWTEQFHEVLDGIAREIEENLDEPVTGDEDARAFALSRLKLRCFELFQSFDPEARAQLLASADELIRADGKIDPAEEALRQELVALLAQPAPAHEEHELDDHEIELVTHGEVIVEPPKTVAADTDDHPFFARTERPYAKEKETFLAQAQKDVDLLRKVMGRLEQDRGKGRGKLKLGATFKDFAEDEPFLDGHVYVHPTHQKPHELLVLGDLHGCYSCLKAALLQADFFEKVQRYHDDPENQPNMLLVLLGDYIDRGKFSYNGVLRTVLSLYHSVPEHVIPLRGNHEYYVELNGRIYGAVKPCEAMTELKPVASDELFAEYMRLFEALPNMLALDQLFFVHAGIPRDDTMEAKFDGIDTLNDPELRFQMLWSDPSHADAVPVELQKQSARFAFGRQQFRRFMQKIGCTTMIRGHEKIDAGFREVYPDADARLLNLFSAGGKTNSDLPAESSYRDVTPMALTIKLDHGVTQITPFAIDFERYNDPKVNAFFRELAHVE
jgi:hypothetical protein